LRNDDGLFPAYTDHLISERPELTLLVAIYPALFHYANNVAIAVLPSLLRVLLLHVFLAILVYVLFFVLYRWHALRAAVAASIFLVFFHTYGILFNYFVKLDAFQVEHYVALPLYLLAAVYASWLAAKLSPSLLERAWNGATLVLAGLLIFNLVRIVPRELAKAQPTAQAAPAALEAVSGSSGGAYPDIYYIVLDEFSGFEPMRQYWNYHGVDNFKASLEAKGFLVTEKSRSSSIDTLHQMAERLNYREIPEEERSTEAYFDALEENSVVRYLKSRGYTTVVFDEKNFGYSALPEMKADYSFRYGLDNATVAATDMRNLFDDFGILVADNTMLQAFPVLYNRPSDPFFEKHVDMVNFTAAKVGDLAEIQSPKFVYVHLLLPHYPFMFSADGTMNDPSNYYNWNYYLGTYIFSMDLLEKMADDILKDVDPAHPPIIILQSDHGARNFLVSTRNGVILEDFPEEYSTHILNAMYLPGIDTSPIEEDFNPINTFPFLFNALFDAGIPLK
jgi:hypothetical protein